MSAIVGVKQQQQQQLAHNGREVKPTRAKLNGVAKTAPSVVSENQQVARPWRVQASDGAMNTSNPIREIIEGMNLAKNPDKQTIPLSIGDPTIFGNLKPCKEILEAIEAANNCGKYYGYQTAAGMEAAREAVAEYHYKCTGNRVAKQDIILASGCSHAIDLSICVLAQHGQNILIPRPGFPLYKTLTSVYGVQFKQYDLLADKNWSIDLEHLESLIDNNTAAIIINNPSNPCGSVFSKRHLLQILQLAEKHRLPIIADEIYDKFIFSPELYESPATKKKASGRGRCAHRRGHNNNHHNNHHHNHNHHHHNLQSEQKQTLVNNSQKQETNHLHKHQVSINSIVQTKKNLENWQPTSTNGIGNKLLGSSSSTDHGSLASDESTSSDSDHYTEENYSEETVGQEVEEELVDDLIESDDDSDQDDDGLHFVPFRSMSSLSKVVPILTCGGISKTCLIPGLRLGWIIINDRENIFDGSIRNGLNRLTQRLMGPNSLVQGALHDILTNVPDSFYKQTMDFIFQNAKLCHDRLKLIPGLRPYMPQGSMYLMVKFDEKLFPHINGDLDFTSKLMNEESVLVLPGKCFDFPNYFRICLTVPTDVMDEALMRIEEFCQRHYQDNNTINGSDEHKSFITNGKCT